MASFTFHFELATDEQVRASRLINLRRPVIKSMLAGSVALGLAATGAFVTGVAWPFQDASNLVLAWCIPVGVLAGLFLGPQVQVQALRRRNRTAAGAHVFSLTDAGLNMSSLGASATLQWENVVEVFESREFILFYFASSFAQVLPKRVVPQESLPSLRAALAHWVGKRWRGMG